MRRLPKPSPKPPRNLVPKFKPHVSREEWVKGVVQNLDGETRAEFIKVFLGAFPADVRKSMENLVDDLYGIRNSKRFRAKLLHELAMCYYWGIVHTRSKIEVDLYEVMKQFKQSQKQSVEQGLRNAQATLKT